MHIDPLVLGLTIMGLVVALALIRFRDVLTKFTFGGARFHLRAKNGGSPPEATSTRLVVGDITESSDVDIVGGSRADKTPSPGVGNVDIKVGDVGRSRVKITGRDDSGATQRE
jgi:hypothetical protein